MQKTTYPVTIFIIVFLCFFVSSCVCINCGGNNLCTPVTKELKLEREMRAGMTFSAETMHSYIKVTGWDEKYCDVRAKVKVRAEDTEKAKQIAESIKVSLQESGNTMTLITDKLGHHGDHSVYADYDVKLPRDSSVILKTSHDPIECRNLKGDVTATTSHDPITCVDISGNLKLNTSHDPIILTNITGNVEARTSHDPIKLTNITGKVDARTTHDPIEADNITGDVHLSTSHDPIRCNNLNTEKLIARTSHSNINIAYSEQFKGAATAEVTTSHGNISFELPLNYSGTVSMSTTHGKVKTEYPITASGEISEKKISGTIGEKGGAGKINLKTTHGSIFLK